MRTEAERDAYQAKRDRQRDETERLMAEARAKHIEELALVVATAMAAERGRLVDDFMHWGRLAVSALESEGIVFARISRCGDDAMG